MAHYNTTMYLVVLLLGVILGSFINAFVWRLHLKNKKNTGNVVNISILTGRSMCPNCKHQLSAFDLVPIFSWLYLRGKCKYCHKTISVEYPIIEALTGLLFFLSYKYWPLTFNSWGDLLIIIWFTMLIFFISLALYDLKYKILPNNLVYIVLFLTLVFEVIDYINYNHTFSFILSRLLGLVFSSGIFYVIFQLSNGRWIVGGDIKLCLSLGLLLGGPLEAILMIFIASVTGCLIYLLLIIFGKYKTDMTIAFGPLLITGTYICFFFGPQIINWYSTIIG